MLFIIQMQTSYLAYKPSLFSLDMPIEAFLRVNFIK